MNMPGNLLAQMSSALGKDEKKLLDLFKGLSASDRQTLLAFAGFLASQSSDDSPTREPKQRALPEPVHEAGPDGESVIKAIKRLSRVYFMIDRSVLLNETSSLMTRHLMQGVPAGEIILELEQLFELTYESMSQEIQDGKDV